MPFARSRGKRSYLGSFHTNLESGHMQNGDHRQLMRVQLDTGQRQRCIALVDEVFDSFTA